MRTEHISCKEGTGKSSMVIETCNFHRAHKILAEYSLDCKGCAHDWNARNI